MSMLKEQASQLPLTRDKKINTAVIRQAYSNKIRNERLQLATILHPPATGCLEPEKPGEQTLRVTQRDIKETVQIQVSHSLFDLDLQFGVYSARYSRNGSTLLLTSSKGHAALLNWREKTLTSQIHLGEPIRHSTFLHSDEMFALCQPNNLFIYDQAGTELHKLEPAIGVQYFPYHFLLASYDCKRVRYYDTTTGAVVASHIAKAPYSCIAQNHQNAVLALGTNKGVVQWWTPGIGHAQVKLFAGGPVGSMAFHDNYLYTASDTVKVWDLRMLKVLHEYHPHRRLNSLSVSQSGLVALNYGFRIEFMKDMAATKQTHPYMKHSQPQINSLQFVPFEDLLGIGCAGKFSCIAVPGSGIARYDTFENNPFETKKQKRESLVHQLLDKLPMETITIDPNLVGTLDKTAKSILDAEAKEEEDKKYKEQLEKTLAKNRSRGGSSIKSKINVRAIEAEKKRRKELGKIINAKLLAKWAEKKKQSTQAGLLEQMDQEGISAVDLLQGKTKKIKKSRIE